MMWLAIIFIRFFSTGKDEILETATRLQDVAMNDEYFIRCKVAPNMDFWYVIVSFYQWASVAELSDLKAAWHLYECCGRVLTVH